MAEFAVGPRRFQPLADSDSGQLASDGKRLLSFDSFENLDMSQDCRGWLTEAGKSSAGLTLDRRFWCVAASRMLGLFDAPEEEQPKAVLTLSKYVLEDCCRGRPACHGEDHEDGSPSGADAPDPSRLEEFVLALQPTVEGERQHVFIAPTEKDYLLWRETLSGFMTVVSPRDPEEAMLGGGQLRGGLEECRRTDSGFGDDGDGSPSAPRRAVALTRDQRRLTEQGSLDSEGAGTPDWESSCPSGEPGKGRSSSFVSQSAEELPDSRSAHSDSVSGGGSSDHHSALYASEPELDSDTCSSHGRSSLNDSVFLGGTTEWEGGPWGSRVDSDSLSVDGTGSVFDGPTGSNSMDGPHHPHANKTVITKMSKLAQRVGLLRRAQPSSGLTLGHLPDIRLSGPMRRKGKSRWYALSGDCLYCFKSNSPEARVESITDLTSHTVAIQTEEKEDGQSVGILILTHLTTSKKVLLAVRSIETAQLWFSYLEDVSGQSSGQSSRPDGHQSTDSTSPETPNPRPLSMSSRLSRESFEESYGFFERQSSLRAERDAVHNAISQAPNATKQGSTRSSVTPERERRQKPKSLDDFGRTGLAYPSWGSSEDLRSAAKREGSSASATAAAAAVTAASGPGFFAKHPVRSSLPPARCVQQMPIPAADVVDPSLTGHLLVLAQRQGNWQRHWAVLKDHWLYLYKNSTDNETVDAIDLTSCTVQRERSVGEASPLAQDNISFCILNKDGSHRAILKCETDKASRLWLDMLVRHTKRQSTTLDSLNLASCSPMLHKRPPEPVEEKASMEQAEAQRQQLLMEILQQNKLASDEQQRASQSYEVVDPQLAKRKEEILSKYQKANAEEEEELVRLMTILNRRRVSAQVKMEAFRKTLGSGEGRPGSSSSSAKAKVKAKRRPATQGQGQEEALMEEQIGRLAAQLAGIRAEMEAQSTQRSGRLEALRRQKDLELKLLGQRERLARYRRRAQDVLCHGGNSPPPDLLEGLTEEEDTSDRSTASVSSEEDLLKDQPSPPPAVVAAAATTAAAAAAAATAAGASDKTNGTRSPSEIRLRRASPVTSRPSAPRSPTLQHRRLLPTLPSKRLGSATASPPGGRDSPPHRLSDEERRVPVLSSAGSPPEKEKKSSPLARLRKLSSGGRLGGDQPSRDPRFRKLSMGLMKSSASFDEGLSLQAGGGGGARDGKAQLKLSSSSTDLRKGFAEATSPRETEPAHQAPPKQSPRRKISVPIRMPSMENLFSASSASSTSSAKNPKAKGGLAPSLRGGLLRKAAPNGASLSPSSSPDINGNVQTGRGQPDRPKGKILNDEIDPEVLRDIEEFEMIARKALQEAGWILQT